MCSRGVAVTSEDRASACSLLRACLGARRDADLLHGARTISRARLTAAAIHHGESERVPRRTLRSPGAERSRLPYAAKPRGRGRAAEGGSAPTDRREEPEATRVSR